VAEFETLNRYGYSGEDLSGRDFIAAAGELSGIISHSNNFANANEFSTP
jgi:hypothetical protein